MKRKLFTARHEMQVIHMIFLYRYRYGSMLPIRLNIVKGNTLRDAYFKKARVLFYPAEQQGKNHIRDLFHL